MKKVLFSFLLVLSLLLVVSGCKKEGFNYLILVNKENKLPDNYEEIVELEDATNAFDETIQVEKKALKKFNELKADLEKEDIHIELDSVYRSVKRQQEIWDEFTRDKGEEYAKKYVATPGYSEHHTGLAIDICLKIDGKVVYDNEEMIAEKEIFSKIHQKLAKYGFILRYPEGKDDITGYSYEPWHFRYIDDAKIAKEIMDKNITLEEYLKK